VVVENYRPGTLERWGIGYDDLKAVRPDVILVRATGYGQTGPYAPKPGFARVGQAFGGLTYLAGELGGPPLTPGSTTLSDYITPIFGAFGTMLALHHRDRTGQGQMVDVALYEATFRSLDTITVDYATKGTVRDRTGRTGAPYAVPHGQFPCKDGHWIALACTGDRMWQRFCKAVGREDLSADDRFATLEPRLANREELDSIVDSITSQHNRDDLLAMFDGEEVAAGPVNSIKDIFNDPHYWAREMLIKVTDPLYGELVMPGVVPKLSETPGNVYELGPPVLGQHNDDIYGGLLGLSDGELEALKTKGVI
jgi:succinyl-CoA:(S)-malate CoA-transferase subunit A/succinyl-CoA:(S)-malate CoA-transferase subunit B